MFTSASTSLFKNTSSNFQSFLEVNTTLYENKSLSQTRTNKGAVQFYIEKNK